MKQAAYTVRRRGFCLLLAIVMLIGLFPPAALATGQTDDVFIEEAAPADGAAASSLDEDFEDTYIPEWEEPCPDEARAEFERLIDLGVLEVREDGGITFHTDVYQALTSNPRLRVAGMVPLQTAVTNIPQDGVFRWIDITGGFSTPAGARPNGVHGVVVSGNRNVGIRSTPGDPIRGWNHTLIPGSRHFHVDGAQARLTLERFTLAGNRDLTHYNGGVLVSAGTLILNTGATIHSCRNSQGGGILLSGNNPRVTINNGARIHNNFTPSGSGHGAGIGAVSTANNVVITMNGGVIENNQAVDHGGGIFINSSTQNVTFNMLGGIIRNNRAGNPPEGAPPRAGTMGGAVAIGTFLYQGFTSNITISGTSQIYGNTATGAGGGLHISGNIIIRDDVEIFDNTSLTSGGGGIDVREGNITIRDNVRLEDNTAHSGGGGLLVRVPVTATVRDNVVFHNNRATRTVDTAAGGGIMNHGTLNITTITAGDTITFTENEAAGGGGGIHTRNALNFSGPGTINITDNESGTSATALQRGGGGVQFWDGSWTATGVTGTVNITDNTDRTGNGGGIYMGPGTALAIGPAWTIADNTATLGHGGGIHISETDASLFATGGQIVGNHAGQDGGGIWTADYDYNNILATGAYANLVTQTAVVFFDPACPDGRRNTAGNGSYQPPSNWDVTQIRGTGTSPTIAAHQTHQLNNYDVNFRTDLFPVTFEMNGGHIGGDTSDVVEEVQANTTVTAARVPANPEREGWTFLGWRITQPALGGTNYTAAQIAGHVITAPRTYTAQWERIVYNVTFTFLGHVFV